MKREIVIILIALLAWPAIAMQAHEIEIPRSMSGDKGRYFLIYSKQDAGLIQAISKRVGVDSIVYSKIEMNCMTRKMRGLGESETSVEDIQTNPTPWFDLISGSSKSDLANYLCHKK